MALACKARVLDSSVEVKWHFSKAKKYCRGITWYWWWRRFVVTHGARLFLGNDAALSKVLGSIHTSRLFTPATTAVVSSFPTPLPLVGGRS